MSDEDNRRTAPVSPEVHRMLLTVQYERKMAGETLSFSDIIKRALEDQQAFARMGETVKELGL